MRDVAVDWNRHKPVRLLHEWNINAPKLQDPDDNLSQMNVKLLDIPILLRLLMGDSLKVTDYTIILL